MNEISWGTDNTLNKNQFYNRKDEINFLTNILDSSKYGSTPTILLTGLRGVGKTALIKKLSTNFEKNYLTVYIDLTCTDSYQQDRLTRESIMEILYNSILKACADKGFKTINKKIEKLYKTHNISIKKFLDYKGIPIPILGLENNYSQLADFVMNLPQTIYEEYKEEIDGIFIFMDEFQVIKELDTNLNNFLWYLRGNIQSQKNVAYIISGSMGIKDELIYDIAGKKGAFGGRMLTFEVKPFSFETTRKYMGEKAENLKFTESGIKRFHQCTKGIPFYINTFAKLLPQNIELDENRILYEFNEDLIYLTTHFQNIWGRLTFQEKKIITSLIDSPLKRVDISKKLGVKSGSLSRSLNRLQDEVLIELDEDKYKIIDSIFIAWLKKEYDERGVYPYKSV